ncbi:MAG: hypothetical protein ACI93R_003408 [Flavobacteriales bacterium]|jgi:uncharacterized protein (DUF1330 family)
MSAYVEIRIKAEDPSLLKNYQKVAPGVIQKYNGKFIVRGGEVITLEGEPETRRIVIIEFSSIEEAKAFYYSNEYTHAIELRKGVAVADIIVIDGI